MRIVRLSLASVLITLVVTATGCGGDDTSSSMDLSIGSDLATAFDQGFARASEADIASILLTLNAGEIMVAEAAQPGLTTAGARDFAQMMIDMHGAASTRQMALFKQLGITPNDNNMFTMKLTAEATRIIGVLGNLGGAELDRFYVDTQVQMHSGALDLIDFVMLPNAKTPMLVSEIMTTRVTVAAHLDAAKALQGSLAADGGI
jgi:putative membrane protein